MILSSLILVLFSTYAYTQITESNNVQADSHYNASIVEMGGHYDKDTNFAEFVTTNAEMSLSFIEHAKNASAEIIVFPEYFLTSPFFMNYGKLSDGVTPVPNPEEKSSPCDIDNPSGSLVFQALRNISCKARSEEIYVVINLLESFAIQEKDGTKDLIYNTNVIFDRNGVVIAKYRKFNLFEEPYVARPEKPELVTFTTDFGVTFGTFICFDILFSQPALQLLKNTNATDFVYPTAWFSETPFLTALQVSAGWARANGVNLLTAGYHDPLNGAWSNGLYSAEDGLTADVSLFTSQPDYAMRRMPIIKTKKINYDGPYDFEDVGIFKSPNAMFKILEDSQFDKYTLYNLTEPIQEKSVCYEDFCCKFSVKYREEESNDTYVLVVYNGTRNFASTTAYIQICALVACIDEEPCGVFQYNRTIPTTFTQIDIKGDFYNGDFNTQFPSTLHCNLEPVFYGNYTYHAKHLNMVKQTELKLTKNLQNLLSFGVYNVLQNYTLQPNFAYSTNSNFMLLMCLFVIKYLWLNYTYF